MSPQPDHKPRLLDLFCGAGGAAKGYQRAGFYVVGVDNRPQPNYCGDEFLQTDAVAILGEHVWQREDGWPLPPACPRVDAIHASPPCQHDTTMGQRYPETQAAHPDLIGPTQAALRATGLPYVIENVLGARRKLDHPIVVCGRAVGLGVRRHRLFECNFPVMTSACVCNGSELPVYGKLDGRRVWTRSDGSELRAARTLEQASAAMGIDWMTWDELREAIPPAYTEHIGGYLMREIECSRAEHAS